MSQLEKIHVVLADVPPLLASVLEKVLDAQGDLTVSRVHGDARAPLGGSPRGAGEIVVTTDASTRRLAHLSPACGAPRNVLVLERDGREVALYELRPERHDLGEASPERIVAAIRETANRSRAPAAWFRDVHGGEP